MFINWIQISVLSDTYLNSIYKFLYVHKHVYKLNSDKCILEINRLYLSGFVSTYISKHNQFTSNSQINLLWIRGKLISETFMYIHVWLIMQVNTFELE